MHTPHATRPRLDTLDYDPDAATDLILPLTNRSDRGASPSSSSRVRAQSTGSPAAPLPSRRPPMIVDKDQLVAMARVLRPVAKTVPTRVPRLSGLVFEERVADCRRARQRTWLMRIAVVASLELGAFGAFALRTSSVSAFLRTCLTQRSCVAAR